MDDNKNIKKECVCEHPASEHAEPTTTVDLGAANEGAKSELEACKAQAEQWQQKYLMAVADMQNFKNRVEKERAVWMRSAQGDILKKLLPTIDDFDRMMQQSANTMSETQKEGLEMIHKSFHKFLSTVGVTPMTDYTVFDPEKHEAIVQVVSEGHTSGQIVAVIENGYLFGDVVLRPAKVSVAQ